MNHTATNERPLPSTKGEFHHAKRSAALFSVLAALGVTLLKLLTVDFTRSRKLHRIATETNSEALQADAMHFRTDIWSSLAVLLGLAATYTGQHWSIPQLELADPIAAILVACIILHITWKLARRT